MELTDWSPDRGERVILVVDDEPDIAAALERLLEKALDVSVVTAADYPAALTILRTRRVDVIVSDYRIPGGDGITLLAEAAEIAPGTPRILMTAFTDLQVAMRAINEAKIDRFFSKPLEPLEVVKVVGEALDEREASDSRVRDYARALYGLSRPRPRRG